MFHEKGIYRSCFSYRLQAALLEVLRRGCETQFTKYVTLFSIALAPQPSFTSSKVTVETLEQGVKYFQS